MNTHERVPSQIEREEEMGNQSGPKVPGTEPNTDLYDGDYDDDRDYDDEDEFDDDDDDDDEWDCDSVGVQTIDAMLDAAEVPRARR